MADSKKGRADSFPMWGTLLLIFLIAVISAGTYYFKGGISQWQRQTQVVERLARDPAALQKAREAFESAPSQQTAEEWYLIARAKLEQTPEDANAWREFAEVCNRLNRLEDAWNAIQKSLQLNPKDLHTRFVQAQILSSTKNPQDKQSAQEILKTILQSDPANNQVRMMLGFNAYSLGDYQLAIDSWTKILETETHNQTIQPVLERSISVARERLANKDKESSADNASIRVRLHLNERIKRELKGSEVIYLIVRSTDNASVPLAVKKFSLASLPDEIEITDKNAMTPTARLSQASSVVVLARISKRGNAIKEPGDIESGEAQLKAPFNGQIVSLSFDPNVEPQVLDAEKTAENSINTGADSVGLTVSVSISEKIKQSLTGNEILYVFAKAASGPPMPLAVKRIPVNNIPETIQLSDNDAMRPELKLSSFDKVNLSARISKSGNAIKQAGDIQSETVTVALPHSELIRVVIE